jgi:uncharacterized membrane protein YedE/YeeE
VSTTTRPTHPTGPQHPAGPTRPTSPSPTGADQSSAPAHSRLPDRAWLVYLALGIGFGTVLTKAGVVSWFRMQEMFRFQSFHMYGIIGSALAVAMASIALLKRFRVRAANGALITIPPKEMGRGIRYVAGGVLFGIGWALTGACPGPLVAQIGAGASVMLVAFVSALAGTMTYGMLRSRLPH